MEEWAYIDGNVHVIHLGRRSHIISETMFLEYALVDTVITQSCQMCTPNSICSPPNRNPNVDKTQWTTAKLIAAVLHVKNTRIIKSEKDDTKDTLDNSCCDSRPQI